GEAPFIRRRLDELGVSMLTQTIVDAIQPGDFSAHDAFGRPLQLNADAIVLVTQRVADDRLYRDALSQAENLREAGVRRLFRVGDCVAPRMVADAIFDGHRLARELDGENPERPLPHTRERSRLIGVSA